MKVNRASHLEHVAHDVPAVLVHDSLKKMTTVKLTGAFVLSDILALIGHQVPEDAWRYPMLVDLRELTDIPASIDVQRIADRIQAIAPRRASGPQAFVTPHDTTQRLVTAYASRIAPNIRVKVFTDISDAEQWLRRRAAGLGTGSFQALVSSGR